jgi:hypothetical protein
LTSPVIFFVEKKHDLFKAIVIEKMVKKRREVGGVF